MTPNPDFSPTSTSKSMTLVWESVKANPQGSAVTAVNNRLDEFSARLWAVVSHRQFSVFQSSLSLDAVFARLGFTLSDWLSGPNSTSLVLQFLPDRVVVSGLPDRFNVGSQVTFFSLNLAQARLVTLLDHSEVLLVPQVAAASVRLCDTAVRLAGLDGFTPSFSQSRLDVTSMNVPPSSRYLTIPDPSQSVKTPFVELLHAGFEGLSDAAKDVAYTFASAWNHPPSDLVELSALAVSTRA